MVATNGHNLIVGTNRNDTIYGTPGDDVIYGGAGNDDIDGGPGADDIHGGPGFDAALYGGRTTSVIVTLDNLANDGQAGEGDNVHTDVEQIYGGSGSDRLVGDLVSNAPAELIDGGPGNDFIVGGSGENHLYGGAGNDYMNSFNGKVDVVNCGSGNDRVVADASDVVVDCERRVPPPQITSRVNYAARFFGSPTVTVFDGLTVGDVPVGGSVEVICRGGGCPFGVKRPRLGASQRQVSLTGLFRGRRLRARAQLEVRITKPNVILKNAIGEVVVITMQLNSGPLCVTGALDPGDRHARDERPCPP